MRIQRGFGYLGASKIETSIANQEVVPSPPVAWTMGYRLYKFSFMNYQDVNFIINGETNLFSKAGQGFEMDGTDAPIHSFVIVDEGVEFQWRGAY